MLRPTERTEERSLVPVRPIVVTEDEYESLDIVMSSYVSPTEVEQKMKNWIREEFDDQGLQFSTTNNSNNILNQKNLIEIFDSQIDSNGGLVYLPDSETKRMENISKFFDNGFDHSIYREDISNLRSLENKVSESALVQIKHKELKNIIK